MDKSNKLSASEMHVIDIVIPLTSIFKTTHFILFSKIQKCLFQFINNTTMFNHNTVKIYFKRWKNSKSRSTFSSFKIPVTKFFFGEKKMLMVMLEYIKHITLYKFISHGKNVCIIHGEVHYLII